MSEQKAEKSLDNVFYFAYHLDMNPAKLMERGIQVLSMRAAILEGYQLVFNVLEDEAFHFESRGLANLFPKPGWQTEGVLYETPGEALALLDRLAGVPDLKYYRKSVSVWVQEESVSAFTYVAWPDVTAHGLLPSRRYLMRLMDAAQRPGCSRRFLQWLAAHPTSR